MGADLGTDTLTHLREPGWITDGGLETTLVFHEGLDLPDFAAFPLLDSADGRQALERYFAAYLDIAERDGVGMVLDTPTWRASSDWATRLGYDDEGLARLTRDAVVFAQSLGESRPHVPTLVDLVAGPRGDGYLVGEAMTADQATTYHGPQIRIAADAGADLVTAVTMTYSAEAVGIARAAQDAGIPAAISFTVETDGRLPSGESLGDAIQLVDSETDDWPAYFMVNCAHPTHFKSELSPGESWLGRVRGVRANASTMSHEELDNAEVLDRGDVRGLAAEYVDLMALLPDLRLVGGCCGTDHEHVDEISRAWQNRLGG